MSLHCSSSTSSEKVGVEEGWPLVKGAHRVKQVGNHCISYLLQGKNGKNQCTLCSLLLKELIMFFALRTIRPHALCLGKK